MASVTVWIANGMPKESLSDELDEVFGDNVMAVESDDAAGEAYKVTVRDMSVEQIAAKAEDAGAFVWAEKPRRCRCRNDKKCGGTDIFPPPIGGFGVA